MEDDMWCVSSSGSSRSYRSETAVKYQSGPPYLDLEEFDEDGDIAVDYPCPFCSDDYDLVELCRHIDDEHHQEDYNGTCPVCSKRVKMHMVDHITTHHRDVLKISFLFLFKTFLFLVSVINVIYLNVLDRELYSEQKEMSYREDPYSSDKCFQSPHDELPAFMNQHHTSKSVVSDKFLSFINSTPLPNQTKLVQPGSSVEDKNLIKDSSAPKEGTSSSPLSDSEQLEKAKKCQFVQGLLSSAMFDDGCDFF